MKFFVFNLVVVGALVYLLGDGSFGPAEPGSVLDQAQRLAGAITDQGRDLARDAGVGLLDREADADPWSAPEFADSEIAPAPTLQAPAEIEPRPASLEAQAIAEAVAIDDPSIARRRAEVLGEVEIAASDGAAEPLGFMTPRERQRELDALAEDMELLFADKVGR